MSYFTWSSALDSSDLITSTNHNHYTNIYSQTYPDTSTAV